jgi:drug/metabolite transporter (DMT)-like permease
MLVSKYLGERYNSVSIRISGLCLLISTSVLSIAVFSKLGAGEYLSPNTISMLVLLAVAISCLGALELRIHRRTKSRQQRIANTLASALRNGALR